MQVVIAEGGVRQSVTEREQRVETGIHVEGSTAQGGLSGFLRDIVYQCTAGIAKAVNAAMRADAVLVCAGEESILSGEAHSLADLHLQGAQSDR